MASLEEEKPYTLEISRLILDKLGVKLYDRASAVVAELVANAHDADAEEVTVSLPLGVHFWAKDEETGERKERGFTITVKDDGHGMTPQEAQEHFLRLGADRRLRPEAGNLSRGKSRPVMGRKGIGKLAPFGICRRIEIESAGGVKTDEGFLCSHFILDYDTLVQEGQESVPLQKGSLDRTFKEHSGTVIRLSEFLDKRVPSSGVFMRQLSARFGLGKEDFRVLVADTNSDFTDQLEETPLELDEGTKIVVDTRPVLFEGHDGSVVELPMSGWMAKAKHSYKDEALAGVRIYSRGKIVAQTRDFEQPAGFTSEFTIRSYLVGQIHAEWLDQDEDLIRTDRQGILWESDKGSALREWGANLIKEIGRRSQEPRRLQAKKLFFEAADFVNLVNQTFDDEQVRKTALDLGGKIGAFAAMDELNGNDEYVKALANVVLSVAPHKALMEALEGFSKSVNPDDSQGITSMLSLFGKAQVAEMASYAQIARERVRVIGLLEEYIAESSAERHLQELLQRGRWLIEPSWMPLTANQSLKRFKDSFERFWLKKHGEAVELSVENETKRPDFILIKDERLIRIVEIKAADHKFANEDFDRLYKYISTFRMFSRENPEILPAGSWQIVLVADDVNITDSQKNDLFQSLIEKDEVVRRTWEELLARAKQTHQEYLEARDAAGKMLANINEDSECCEIAEDEPEAP